MRRALAMLFLASSTAAGRGRWRRAPDRAVRGSFDRVRGTIDAGALGAPGVAGGRDGSTDGVRSACEGQDGRYKSSLPACAGGGGGGGGAGGAVLIESPTVSVRGALTANGGGGGPDA